MTLERAMRARVFAQVNRNAMLRPPIPGLGSITWGTRQLGSIIDTGIDTAPFDPGMFPPGQGQASGPVFQPIASGPIVAQPPIIVGPVMQLPPASPAPPSGGVTATTQTTLPAQVPIVTTPASGPIPSPGTVAAGTTTATSWLDQQMITGIPNSWLLLGGAAAFLLFGGHKK